MKKKHPKGGTQPQRLDMAMELLQTLAGEEKTCSLSALARRAGISRYRTKRLLESLEQKEAGGSPQPKVNGAGQARGVMEAFYGSIAREVRPVMESLARKHKEAVYMTFLKGDEVLFVDVAEVEAVGKGEPLVGRRFPFFKNAAGKVMRAIDSWDLLEKIGKSWRRGRFGFPELSDLRRELELIREKGFAVECGGMGEGIITVAVAVRDYAGKVVGALTLLGPSVRLIGSRLEEEIIPSLRMSGELLSMKFGYARP
ncbi:IclR family transcriptional regulator [Geoanaerobacter pelophilus]|nr:IclR family transcriptional regulator C-terminal domain-containing protein [Geoanaerobacter pelophilus]